MKASRGVRAGGGPNAGPASVAALAALTAAALAIAGCGSGGGDSTSSGGGQSQRAPEITTVVGSSQTPQEAADAAMEKTGAPGPGTELQPLPARAFRRPVAEYRTYAVGQARLMDAAVSRLRDAVAAGDVGRAQRAWLEAYDRYLRLGAAYGALGELDGAINGGAGGLPGGVHDPEFTGLHRVELGLWSNEPPAELRAPVALLAADVAKLPAKLRRMSISPLDYATRAHEILEDAQRDMLSGTQAPWSGAGLRATGDALAATEAVVATLRPLLSGRGEALAPVEAELTSFGRVLAAVRRDHGGGWPTLATMTRDEHERVNGALGALLERLAAIPGTLEAKPPTTVPTIASQEEAAG